MGGYKLVRVSKQDTGLSRDFYLFSSGRTGRFKRKKPKVLIALYGFWIPVKILTVYEERLLGIHAILRMRDILRYLQDHQDVIEKHWRGELSDKEILNLLY